MKIYILPSIELVALVGAICFGVLWILYPNDPYEPPFALCGFVFVITEVLRRYLPKFFEKKAEHSFIDINSKNTLIARFDQVGSKKSGKMCVAFYDMKIVNASDKPYTIKDVLLRYRLNGQLHECISSVVITGTVYSLHQKKEVNALIVHNRGGMIVLHDWDNLRTNIGKNKVIVAGGIVDGSAIFVLEAENLTQVENIEEAKFVVRDYMGAESIIPIQILSEWIEYGKTSVIRPNNFSIDKDGKIEFP